MPSPVEAGATRPRALHGEHRAIGAPRGSAVVTVELSVVVPVYNEAGGVEAFFARLGPVLERLRMSYEIICVDDGSTDGSLACLLEFRKRMRALKVLSLCRNRVRPRPLSAGSGYACGAAVVPVASDLQDPPEITARMVATGREGYDVVYATGNAGGGQSARKRGEG